MCPAACAGWGGAARNAAGGAHALAGPHRGLMARGREPRLHNRQVEVHPLLQRIHAGSVPYGHAHISARDHHAAAHVHGQAPALDIVLWKGENAAQCMLARRAIYEQCMAPGRHMHADKAHLPGLAWLVRIHQIHRQGSRLMLMLRLR